MYGRPLCVIKRKNRPSRRVKHNDERRCGVCQKKERKHAEREWTRYRIGAVAKRFADGEKWALSYKEFRQRFLTAMGEGGDWREEEWGKKDINVGASYAWRRYKEMGKSAAAVNVQTAAGN